MSAESTAPNSIVVNSFDEVVDLYEILGTTPVLVPASTLRDLLDRAFSNGKAESRSAAVQRICTSALKAKGRHLNNLVAAATGVVRGMVQHGDDLDSLIAPVILAMLTPDCIDVSDLSDGDVATLGRECPGMTPEQAVISIIAAAAQDLVFEELCADEDELMIDGQVGA